MSGISVGHLHPRPCSGEKTLRRCRNNEEANKVILIDVDTENFDNVVIIDVPESLPKKTQPSSMHKKDKTLSVRNIIYIDDDENHDRNHSLGVNNARFSAGTSSNRESYRIFKNFPDVAFEESQCVQDTATPVRLSKCKRTYSGKGSKRKGYGLNSDSESDSSDNDCPDCELVEDSSGKVQEQWEKASSRRKKDFQNGHSDIRDHDSTSFGFSTGKFNNEKDDPSCSRTKEDTDFGCTHAFDVSVDLPDCEPESSNRHVEENCVSFAFTEESDKEFGHPTPAFEETSKVEPCPPKYKSRVGEDSCCGKSSPLEDEATIFVSKNSFETEDNPSRSFPETGTSNAQEREHLESGQSHATGGAKEMENLITERCTFKRSSLSSLSKGFRNSHLSEVRLREDKSMSNIQQEEDKDGQLRSQSGETSPFVEMCIISEREKLKETDEYKRAMEEEWASRRQVLQIQAEEAKNLRRYKLKETCIISEREMLKETDEYKRAMEEELASRQQALQIQAEEAKRLRRLQKRRKAESMRLLDMERRQKERLEEVRNIQKKDEENMNLKERIRAEVRNELKKLEVSCHSMASLLNSLGIRVGGWPNPLPQEVQTAYKRALLTFHPDRASKSDIRQQVEAEEKFKLINRLKEKFPPSL